ncbi:MBL fold metallo-hydrolase [Nocardioides marmorisolisilvae]|uniref:MBL fold metallo-hydrolase n=1 Tax=Nocardioides marmorisolisilvae TaxID=1542737 RepID=A0A3N0E0I4_9ACTN|nr:MBL fold metallo-hydrolase [Nocardioides marmorisolisilvae]RNL81253.1 MBL fold metallo-hydrolase [Nocardioides marmorisolisilvae]
MKDQANFGQALPPTAVRISPDSGLNWTEPGAWQVAPGVRRIPLPLPMDGLRAVNVYVMETDGGLVLVDGGWAIPESREVFESSMREAGYALSDIRRFLVTHLHRDHYTQAYVVGREVGAPVSMGIGDKPSMDLMHDRSLGKDPNLTRLEAAGAVQLAEGWRAMMPTGRPAMDDYGMPDIWLDEDLVLDLGGRSVEAISTPGHTQGHYVFAEKASGLLFAGDHVLPTITPSVGFEPRWVEQPLRDFMDSLVKVRDLPDLMLLPAHGPVAPSSHARVDELLEHHRVRLDQCRAAVAGGAVTAWDVAGELGWTRHERRRDELGPFDAVLAAFETLAHLDLLTLRGDLDRSLDGPEKHYALPTA